MNIIQICNHKTAFTLAEILITIATIGIVAAMTIPSLISKYNRYTTATKLKKTYSELLQVIRLSETDNGSFREWDYSLSDKEFAEKYIIPYFQNVETKGHNNIELIKLNGEKEHRWGYVFKYNGKSAVISNTVVGTVNVKYASILVDINGSPKTPQVGRDLFEFTLFNYTYLTGAWVLTPLCPQGEHYGLYPGGIAGYWGTYCASIEQMEKSSPWGNCNINGDGASCAAWIQKNDWKIPDNYPIKF